MSTEEFEFENSENEETAAEEILTEEMLDMDEIDAILSDVSDVHPERTKSAEELEERIAKYEENPEAAEEALLAEEEENEEEVLTEGDAEAEATSEDTEEVSEPVENQTETVIESSTNEADQADLDFLSSLENVDDLLADVENKANEESERIQAELNESSGEDVEEINDILHQKNH